MKKNNDLMDGKGEGGKWITINGSHVFIEDGQSVEDAMNKTFDKKGINNSSSNSKSKVSKKEQSTSQQIKQKLKESGIDTKSINIRERWGGYSVSYNIEIKSPYIDKSQVESIAKKWQNYDTDEATGEILLGGNTYIFTRYQDGTFDEVSKPFFDSAKKYIEDASNQQEGYGISIQQGVSLFKENSYYTLSVRKGDNTHQQTRVYDEKSLARYLFQIKQFNKIVE